MNEADVVVVGGGPAGLSVAGALKQVGRSPVVLDAGDVGSSWRRRYERLHLHTVRAFSGLAHFPIPSNYPKYLSKDSYAEYLQAYARRFDLRVETGTTARDIAPSPAGFEVETDRGSWKCREVVVATGMYREPRLPAFPGIETYSGATLHSSRYKTGSEYTGKRVLVIGVGNSGAEIAADLAEQGATCAIAIRAMPPIVPRDFLGTPVQVFGIALSHIPPGVADRIGQLLARIALGDQRRLGMRAPEWLPFSAKRVPVIDVGFFKNVKAGRIAVRSNVVRFSGNGVIYDDDREEAFDVVVFATGFSTGLQPLLARFPHLLDLDYPRSASGEPTAVPGLYFMGYVESHRGHLYEMNLASRKLAKIMAAR